ncbi:alpha/beta hydrolase family protein [Blautia sp. HCP3S3_H10_1]|uniref:alpha/beta hydrolase family protein n=1 Tax=unclassified Blautia TaxID=2648079 RepID=UPI003F8E2042
MLKKRMLIVLGMAAVLSASCVSATVWAEENAETQTESETETTDESVTENDSTEETGEEAAEADVAEEENPEIQEGYTTELEGCTKVVSWCKNGDNNIYGQFYYPADFDETKTYPVVIMSHGIGSTSQMVERAKWPEKAAQDGYVVYTFDFCGGSLNGNSDVDFMDMTVMTEKEDLSAVMDFVKSKDYVDQEHLFLLGQSQGGLVSAFTAADRKEDVAAMVLVYPALCIADNARETYASAEDIPEGQAEMPVGTVGSEYVKAVYDLDVYGTISAYDGDVMIIHGINDMLVPYSYSEKAIEEAYTSEGSVLVPVYGKRSTHGFEMNFEEGRDYAETVGMEFLDAHLGNE